MQPEFGPKRQAADSTNTSFNRQSEVYVNRGKETAMLDILLFLGSMNGITYYFRTRMIRYEFVITRST